MNCLYQCHIKKQVHHRRYHSLVHKETFYSLCLSSVTVSEGSIWCLHPLEIDFGLCWWLWCIKRIYWLLWSGINLFLYCRDETCSITCNASRWQELSMWVAQRKLQTFSVSNLGQSTALPAILFCMKKAVGQCVCWIVCNSMFFFFLENLAQKWGRYCK